MTVESIPYFLGKKSCEGFRNLGSIDPSLALPEGTPSVSPISVEPPSK